MPEHVHLFVAFPDDKQLTAWIKSLKSVLGKTLTLLGSNRPHWQHGFFDHVLRGGDSYSLKWDYVRSNPVRAGLAKNVDEWPYQGEVVSLPFD